MTFEWDERKRQRNIEAHGIDFLDAALALDGRAAYTFASPRNDEHR